MDECEFASGVLDPAPKAAPSLERSPGSGETAAVSGGHGGCLCAGRCVGRRQLAAAAAGSGGGSGPAAGVLCGVHRRLSGLSGAGRSGLGHGTNGGGIAAGGQSVHLRRPDSEEKPLDFTGVPHGVYRSGGGAVSDGTAVFRPDGVAVAAADRRGRRRNLLFSLGPEGGEPCVPVAFGRYALRWAVCP